MAVCSPRTASSRVARRSSIGSFLGIFHAGSGIGGFGLRNDWTNAARCFLRQPLHNVTHRSVASSTSTRSSSRPQTAHLKNAGYGLAVLGLVASNMSSIAHPSRASDMRVFNALADGSALERLLAADVAAAPGDDDPSDEPA